MTTERDWGTYFGEPWPSGVCDDGRRVPTPVGENCSFCHEVIDVDDQGSFIGNGYDPELPSLVPQHKECGLRAVVGGIGHLEDHAFWCVGRGNDTDGGRTRRQSAVEVWAWVQQHGLPRND